MIKRFSKFCFVGGTTALIDLVLFNIIYSFGVLFIIARSASIVLAVIYNFTMNRNFTFHANNECINKQFPKHITIHTLALIANVSLSTLIHTLYGNGYLIANIAAISGILVGLPISFFGAMKWTFKCKN